MKKIKFGILGVSRHFILRVSSALTRSSAVETHGLASRRSEQAKTWAKKLGIPRWYGSYQELLEDPEIDAVYIPLPNHLHEEWIKKAADAGKHVLCEKPLTLTAAQAQAAVDYCKKAKVKIMEAFMYKCHPQWRRARELAAVGEIGKLRFVHTFFCYSNTNPRDIRNNPEMGGGALYDIGCYAVSAARFLLQKEPVRVLCVLTRDPDFKTDILTSGILDFGEERATFSVSTQSFNYQQVELLGSGGRMRIQIPFNMYPDVPAELFVTTGVGTRCIKTDPQDQYRIEFEEFAGSIINNSEPPVPPSDAVGNMKVIDALFQSAESGRWINL
ncbi:MAG: Gfo/Idh/MocA family oxidoreductase [Spirochaetales bacterium]|nr:Gfo/Idh/MocA family oxidoreductase [Spirochaetales bacterium]